MTARRQSSPQSGTRGKPRLRRSASFFQQVYDVVATIPRGKVMTYGLIGQVLGGFYSGRTVGFAMRVAPAERNLPCHRVVNIKGEMAPGLIFGGADQQQALLKSEGVKFRPDGRIDFDRSLYDPRQPAKTIKSRKKKKPLSRS